MSSSSSLSAWAALACLVAQLVCASSNEATPLTPYGQEYVQCGDLVCGPAPVGRKGETGDVGQQGAPGEPGCQSYCPSVEPVAGGVQVSCFNGSTATVYTGAQGAQGPQGAQGARGAAGAPSVVTRSFAATLQAATVVGNLSGHYYLLAEGGSSQLGPLAALPGTPPAGAAFYPAPTPLSAVELQLLVLLSQRPPAGATWTALLATSSLPANATSTPPLAPTAMSATAHFDGTSDYALATCNATTAVLASQTFAIALQPSTSYADVDATLLVTLLVSTAPP